MTYDIYARIKPAFEKKAIVKAINSYYRYVYLGEMVMVPSSMEFAN